MPDSHSSSSSPSRPPPLVAEYVARQLSRSRRGALSPATLRAIPFLTPPAAAGDALVRSLVPGVFGRIRLRAPRGRPGLEGSVVGLKRHAVDVREMLDAETLAVARAAVAPVPALAAALLANAAEQPFTPFGAEDATVLAGARWFKHTYFRWVDPIKCTSCQGGTQFAGMGEPSAQERARGGGRVELHRCTACGAERRFPRYGEVRALLESREGRCGEFAQLFYVFLLVLGVQARYVWNSEDHVWTEYWSPALGHWTHVDSCEAEAAKPLLYDRGWGKVQRWCLAFGALGAEDVTRAYVDDWDACLARRMQATEDGKGVTEERLRVILLAATVECRGHIPFADREEMHAMDAKQAAWMDNEERRHHEAEKAGLKGKGRESGTKDWVESRGEGGDGAGTVAEPKGEGEGGKVDASETDV